MSLYTRRGDSLNEYYTGALVEGGAQSDPDLCFGGFRADPAVASMGVVIESALSGVIVNAVSGGNRRGVGMLTAVDSQRLTWQSPGDALPGDQTVINGLGVIEAKDAAGKYLRLKVTLPLTPGVSKLHLFEMMNGFYGLPDLTPTQALAGVSQYRCSVVKNRSIYGVRSFKRCLGLLGTPRAADALGLTISGAGTIVTTGSLADWPASGYCQVRTSGGALRETVYYPSRTDTTLTVPATGRALLGTTSSAGGIGDTIAPTPGVAIGLDPDGVVDPGHAFQTIPDATTAPSGITWNQSITSAGGLAVSEIGAGQQFAVWLWRHSPPSTKASPRMIICVSDSFVSY